jgi:hypothetical protein
VSVAGWIVTLALLAIAVLYVILPAILKGQDPPAPQIAPAVEPDRPTPATERAPIATTPAKRLAIVLAVMALPLAVAAGLAMGHFDHAEQIYWFDGGAYSWRHYAGRSATVLGLAAAALWFGGPPLRRLVSWVARGRVD